MIAATGSCDGGRRPFDLVIFDCDGVLVDSEPIVHGAFVATVGEEGFALDRDATLAEYLGCSLALRVERARAALGWTPRPDFAARFARRLDAALARGLQAVPGIRDALSRLALPRCVASNGTHEDVRTRLALAGLRDAFEPHVFSATEVARGKPHPDLFLHAASRFGAAPERCAVVEDSGLGALAGVRAGMTVFGFAALAPRAPLEAAGARAFDRMEDLPGLIAGGRA